MVPTQLVQDRQKLVDSLLAAYAFNAARLFSLTDDEGPGQIWISSTDADFVPTLAMIRRWGLRTLWLQPHPNSSHGYDKDLASIGIEIHRLSSPSHVEPVEARHEAI